MKKVVVLVLFVVATAVAFLAGTRYPRATAPAGRKALYYVDPMHPAYRSDKPGIAPDCGMQLEPVYEGDAPGGSGGGTTRPAGAVSISPDKQQLLGVRVGAVEKASTRHAARLFGRVVLDEKRVFVLNASLEGAIREVSAVTTWSRVKKGQWLASFFSADARAPLQAFLSALDVEAQNPRARAEADLRVAAGFTPSTGSQFAVERLKNAGFADLQIEEIGRKRQIPLLVKIYSPADGFVLARNVSPGQKFDKGAEWYRIANLDRVWILADVSADEAPYVRPGLRAQVSIPGQTRALSASVSEVLPQFDAATRTLKVRLEADNPGFALRPDMFVDVALPIELPAATTIPVDAMLDSGARKTVFVEHGDGTFEPRAIETGWRFGDRVEVVKGLSAGERIVFSGTFLVDSESRIKSAAAGVYGAAARDPVCGMDVDEAKAKAAGKVLEHQGKSYLFCSEPCREQFRASPERYLGRAEAPEHKHPL